MTATSVRKYPSPARTLNRLKVASLRRLSPPPGLSRPPGRSLPLGRPALAPPPAGRPEPLRPEYEPDLPEASRDDPGRDDADLDDAGLPAPGLPVPGLDDPGLPEPGFDVPRYEPPAELRAPPGRPLDGREEEDGRSFDMADHATAGWERHAPPPANGPKTQKTHRRQTRSVRFLIEIRRRPTLPGDYSPSTIGADRLNFRVRDGNGCDPVAMVTEISCQ